MDRQLALKIAFYALLGLTVLWTLWELIVAPAACPVPMALLSQAGTVPCLEFWVARYQTLIAVVPAVSAVYLAYKQLKYVELGRLAQLRQKSAEHYMSISDILSAADKLEASQLSTAAPESRKYSEAEFESYKNNMIAILKQRQDLLRDLIRRSEQSDVPIEAKQEVRKRSNFVSDLLEREIGFLTSNDIKIGISGDAKFDIVWSTHIAGADAVIRGWLLDIRNGLAQLQGGLVQRLVNPE